MYAELVQTSEGLNNIVLVQSGMQTKPKAIMEGLVAETKLGRVDEGGVIAEEKETM